MSNRAAWPGRRRASRSGSQEKPFVIPKQLVWEAYKRVKANKGAPGVDRQSPEEFESDLRDNLYKVWNRMSSGAYFPPPVPRPFQDHDVSPRMVNGRSIERPAHRVASVMSMRPAMRSAPIARLRRAAMTLSPDRVLTWDLSS